jgi:hypothetical protein
MIATLYPTSSYAADLFALALTRWRLGKIDYLDGAKWGENGEQGRSKSERDPSDVSTVDR